MMSDEKKYCLDTNAFIEPWNKYLTMKKCPKYWEILDGLAKKGAIFCPEQVKLEIDKVDDDLKAWLGERPHFVREESEDVQKYVVQKLKK